MGKNDNKKGGDKGGKGKAAGDAGKEAGGKAKGAQSINVRHILVWIAMALFRRSASRETETRD